MSVRVICSPTKVCHPFNSHTSTKKYSPYYSSFLHLKIKEDNMDYFLSLIVKVKLEAHET